MPNSYNFDEENLQLTDDKVTQFTSSLQTTANPDPLQDLCDEAASTVARLTAGYSLDNESIYGFIRSIAVYNAYVNSGTPVSPAIESRYKYAMDELTEIAQGKRPNLAKVTDPTQASISGGFGSGHKIHGRTQCQ